MQELTFEQVEVVSGGYYEIDQANNHRDTVESLCKVVDGAVGGIIGNAIGAIVRIATYGSAAGVGAGLAFITPCANTVLACVDNAENCPTAPEGYIGGPHQIDPLL